MFCMSMQHQIAFSLEKVRAKEGKLAAFEASPNREPCTWPHGRQSGFLVPPESASSPASADKRPGPSSSSPVVAVRCQGAERTRSRATVLFSAHDACETSASAETKGQREFSYSTGLLNSFLPPAVFITQLLTSPIVAHFRTRPCKLISLD
jgi:hypothetical protein